MSVILAFCPITLFYKSLITLAWAGLYVAIPKLTGSDLQHVSAPGPQTEGLDLEKRTGDSCRVLKREKKMAKC